MPRKGKKAQNSDVDPESKTWLDYWEPARPAKRYDMESVDKEMLKNNNNEATTRWDLPKKKVVYLDCKECVSAFDLSFHQNDVNALVKS